MYFQTHSGCLGFRSLLISLDELYGAIFLFLNIWKQVSIYIQVFRGPRQHCFAVKLQMFCGLQNFNQHFIDMVATKLWWDSHFCVNLSFTYTSKIVFTPCVKSFSSVQRKVDRLHSVGSHLTCTSLVPDSLLCAIWSRTQHRERSDSLLVYCRKGTLTYEAFTVICPWYNLFFKTSLAFLCT